MSGKHNAPNWKKMKAEYVQGGISQQKLADKYGITRGTLQYRMRREDWQGQRAAVSARTNQKLIEKTADIQADTAAKLLQMQSRAALAVYEKVLKNIASYPDGIGTKSIRETVEIKKLNINGEERAFPLRSTFVNELEAAVRSMTALARLYGIDAASQLERERLEMKKQQEGSAGTESINSEIISLAELINHPMPDRRMEDIEAEGEADAE